MNEDSKEPAHAQAPAPAAGGDAAGAAGGQSYRSDVVGPPTLRLKRQGWLTQIGGSIANLLSWYRY
jgi:hypothetical protein